MKTSLMKNSTYQPLFYSKMKHSLLDLKKKRKTFLCWINVWGRSDTRVTSDFPLYFIYNNKQNMSYNHILIYIFKKEKCEKYQYRILVNSLFC